MNVIATPFVTSAVVQWLENPRRLSISCATADEQCDRGTARDRVVIELLETVDIDDELIRRCRDLKAQGIALALGDFSGYKKPTSRCSNRRHREGRYPAARLSIAGGAGSSVSPMAREAFGRKSDTPARARQCLLWDSTCFRISICQAGRLDRIALDEPR